MPRFNKNRIAIIIPTDGTSVRASKVCRSLSKMNFDVHFIGWDRWPATHEKPIDLGKAQTHILLAPTPKSRFTIFACLKFAWHIAKCLWKIRPNTVCGVNEEYALLALPFRYLFYRHLVCDVADAVYDRSSHLSWPVRNMLRIVGLVTRIAADRLIATDNIRFETFGRFKKKCIIVSNYPEDPGEDLAKTPLDGPIRIYVNGSIDTTRGIQQLVDALDATEGIEVIAAGWLYDDYSINVFAKHPKVTFHGRVPAKESLQLAAQCDAIFAFYAPISINNRQASPNKIYDAISVGRPVIINEEALVSKWIVDNNVGLRLPYYDVDSLKKTMEILKERRKSLPEFARHARQIFSQGYSWEAMEPRLSELYKGFLEEKK